MGKLFDKLGLHDASDDELLNVRDATIAAIQKLQAVQEDKMALLAMTETAHSIIDETVKEFKNIFVPSEGDSYSNVLEGFVKHLKTKF